jgi:cob(I)alamin adenosyltransferase
MLFTRKGDSGTTKTFGCDQRISKSSAITEALGALDEANSFIGVLRSETKLIDFGNTKISEILFTVQNDLFIIQAQAAGAEKNVTMEKVKWLEEIVGNIESQLPPIKTFLIPGENEISAHFDFARTLVRRAERRVVGVHEENIAKISPETLSYLNRLSSVMYAFARFTSQKSGEKENAPTY